VNDQMEKNEMQTIEDLIHTGHGRKFLESKGVFASRGAFSSQLRVPTNPALTEMLGHDPAKLVFSHQQVYVDCTQSMLDRMKLLAKMEQAEDVTSVFVWIDTDRAGADKIMTRIYWPLFGKIQSIPICPLAVKDTELRFVDLDRVRLDQAIEKLGIFVKQTVSGEKKRTTAIKRYDRLRQIFNQNSITKLSEFNHRTTQFLLATQANLHPTPVIVSDLLTQNILTDQINLVINQIEAVIQVCNTTIESLVCSNIYPVMKPLADDYLPLNYSCPQCQRRLRLRRVAAGGDQYAAAACRCGAGYRFFLGNGTLSIAELSQTQRWSVDISLPLFMFDLVSGLVGGVSSGIYFGIIMNDVLEQVFGQPRIPVLIPNSANRPKNGQVDSLIYRYLTASPPRKNLPVGLL